MKKRLPKNPPAARKLAKLRDDIDRADDKLINALAARFKAVEAVGEVKSALQIPPRQNKRWREVVAQRLAHGSKLGLNRRLLTKIFAIIHGESLRVQTARISAEKKIKKSRST